MPRKLAESVKPGEWTGTATMLFDELLELAGLEKGKRLPNGWPKGARGLGRKLKRLAPALRTQGIHAISDRKDGRT
jgi:hypothetical protein